MPRIVELPSSIFPEAIHKADTGMINIPIVIDISAVLFRISWVTRLTVSTTTNGLTFAYHEGEAPSPARRSTYLGIVAYNWCCTIQNPVMIRIRMIRRPLQQTFISACQIWLNVFPSPLCWLLL